MVWGLGRVLGLEEPARWGGLIDLPPELDEHTLERLCALVAVAGGEDQLALRPAGMLARRLVRSSLGAARAGGEAQGSDTSRARGEAQAGGEGQAGGEAWRAPRGTVLLTGGTGAWGAIWRGGSHSAAPSTSCLPAAAALRRLVRPSWSRS